MTTLNERKLQIVVTELEKNDWHRGNTANALGISHRTLTNYVNEYKKVHGDNSIKSVNRGGIALKDDNYYIFPTNEERLKERDWPNRLCCKRPRTKEVIDEMVETIEPKGE